MEGLDPQYLQETRPQLRQGLARASPESVLSQKPKAVGVKSVGVGKGVSFKGVKSGNSSNSSAKGSKKLDDEVVRQMYTGS